MVFEKTHFTGRVTSVSNERFGAPGGLTLGSATILDGVTAGDAAGSGTLAASIGAHEFGHTIQYLGLAAASGAYSNYRDQIVLNTWGAYLGLGLLGTIPVAGTWWENMASWLGSNATGTELAPAAGAAE